MNLKDKIGCGTTIIAAVLGVVLLILMIIRIPGTDQLAMPLFCVAALFFGIGGVSFMKSGKEDQSKARNELGTLPSFDTNTGELSVFRRAPALRKVISFHDDKNFTTKDDPVKVHYGSATVGGITTGGTYTTGGGQVFSGSYNTGKAYLEYNDILLGIHKDGKYIKGTIKTIRITSEMYNSADSSMKEIINHDGRGYYITVIENAKMNVNEIQYAMGNLTSGHTQDMLKRGYPTRAKCEKILNWLAS